MAEPVVIDLLRHGEVEGDVSTARGCRTEVPLTAAGWKQMRGVADALSDMPLQQVATSPLGRCHAFASEFAAQRNIELAVLDAMREFDFGDWDGKSVAEIGDASAVSQFLINPSDITPPGGEHHAEFHARVVECWQRWLAGASGEHRLLVAHGGVIRVILCHLLQIPDSAYWRLALPYGAWSRVSLLEGEQPRLIFLNREVA